MKLLNKWFLVVKLKSSLRKFYGCHHDLFNRYVCRNHNPNLSSFITYHRACKKSNKTGPISGTGTAYPSGGDLPPVFSGVRAQFFVYCLVDNVLSLVLVGIALSVLLRFMASDCPFDIFKHFFHTFMLHVYVAIRHVRRICTFS